MSDQATDARTSTSAAPGRVRRRIGAASLAAGLLLVGSSGFAAAAEHDDAAPVPAADAGNATATDATAGAPAAPSSVPSTDVPSTDVPAAELPTEGTTPTPATVAGQQPLRSALAPGQVTAAAPSITVDPASGLGDAAQDVVVSGTGFSATANNGVGIYVVFGPKDPQFWLDAAAFKSAKWVHTGGPSPESAGQARLGADGTFRITLSGVVPSYSIESPARTVDCKVEGCYVMTFAAHGATDRSQDTFTAVSFGGETKPGTGTGTVPPPATGGSTPGSTPGATPDAAAPGASVSGAGANGSATGGASNGSSGRNSSAATSSGGATGALARTGSDTTLAGYGLVLVALGMLAMTLRRRYEQAL